MKASRYSKTFFISFFFLICFFIVAVHLSFKNRITVTAVESTGFPSLRIETESQKRIRSREDYVKADYSTSGGNTAQSEKCKIRGRGNTTWQMRKKPYLLKLNSPAPMFGMKEAQKWVLMANGGDNTNLRNAYATYLAENVWNHFKWTPHYKFVNLFINGRYEGLYQVYEKIEASESRLNIPDPNSNFHINGSVILVTDTRDRKPVHFVSSHGIRFALYSPREVPDKMLKFLTERIDGFEAILFGDDFADPEKGYRKYIDVMSFVDWYLINEFSKNRDARFENSCFLYYDGSDGKIDMEPIWDFDLSCGNISDERTSKTSGYWICVEADWYRRLMEDPYFRGKVIERWNSTQDRLQKSFDDIYALSREIKAAAELDDKAWRKIGHYHWPHVPGWITRRTYDAEVDYFMDWIRARRDWLNADIKSSNHMGLQDSGTERK